MTDPPDGLWDLAEWRAAATPDDLMLAEPSGATVTFGEYAERCRALARTMGEALAQEEGQPTTGRRPVAAWQLPTSIDAFVLAGALARLGACQVPLLPIYRARELSVALDQTRPDLVVVPGGTDALAGADLAALADGPDRLRPRARVLHLADGVATPAPVAGPGNGVPVGDEPAAPGRTSALDVQTQWVFFTSGTTAAPKGVRHSDTTVHAAARGMVDALALTSADRHAVVFPFTHIGGIAWLFGGLEVGFPQLVVGAFRPGTTIPAMAAFDVTVAGAGTAFHQAYLAAQRSQPGRPLFPSLRICPGGAAPKPPDLHDRVRDELGGRGVVSGYGLTECPVLAMNSPDDPDEVLATTEGRPLPGVDVRVVTADGREAEPGEPGELRASAPQQFLGYTDPSLDAEALDEHGAVRTGDIGSIGPSGAITIHGRLKDVIIRNGENISAKEVEDLLAGLDAVTEVAVIGLPDPRTGERACAVVVLSDPADPPTLDALTARLTNAGLMRQKLPEQLEIVAELPRNSTGKVLKDQLRTRFGPPPASA